MPGNSERSRECTAAGKWSQSWSVFVRQRRCCAIMTSGELALVRRNVAMGGGTVTAIEAMSSSEITPGPLGIEDTRPTAEAPQAIASCASSGDLMQQILILGRSCMGEAISIGTEHLFWRPTAPRAGAIRRETWPEVPHSVCSFQPWRPEGEVVGLALPPGEPNRGLLRHLQGFRSNRRKVS